MIGEPSSGSPRIVLLDAPSPWLVDCHREVEKVLRPPEEREEILRELNPRCSSVLGDHKEWWNL